MAPHRGGLVLGLGIASLIFACGCIGAILAVVNLVLANRDLAAMRSGAMDPSGMSNTRTGRTLSIVALVVFVVAMIATIAVLTTQDTSSL